MSATRFCAVEKDLEKFIKFLALKSAQVVVQSRLGEKMQTKCNPQASGNDWFNIVIQDHPDVLLETKKALAINPGDSILNHLPLCVEISLQTVENDKMVLEVWSLGIQPETCDPTIRAAHAIYNRMGILLKSLISVTRATPAYKLSRRQSSDSYHIYYRIYVEEPQTHNLGEGYKHVRVGQLSTTVGTLNMSVTYRTKLTISPTQTGRDTAIMLKSDHFLRDLSPKNARYHIKKSEKKTIDLDKPLRHGAFVDTAKLRQYTEEDFILPETPPFSWLIRKTKESSSQETSTEDDKTSHINSPDENNTSNTTITTTNNNNSNFKNFESTDVKMISQTSQKDISGTSPSKSSLSGSREEAKKSKWSKALPPEDEKILKELYFPFASENTQTGDLAKFIRNCFNAPPLQACDDQSPAEEESSIDDLSKQLEQFETSLGDYDSLVTSLGCPSVDSNSNS